MKTENINTAKLMGICNRLCIAPKEMRQAVMQELIECVNGEKQADPAPKESAVNAASAIATLRAALAWPEIHDNGAAVATLCRSLRALRLSE